MKFEEVLQALREGKKIRKIGSRNYYYCLENGRIREYSGVESIGAVFGNDCLLTDWEVVEEKKKVKVRDLTPKQLYRYCTTRTNCRECAFRFVICTLATVGCWIDHKELYSDEFLDQEIEIEEE